MDDKAISLEDFQHPNNVLFILGAEDTGVSPDILSCCDVVVTIPAAQQWSHNVAEAATIVMYSNFSQSLHQGE